MEFDQLMAQLEALRVAAERERFLAAAHQIEAAIDFMRFRARVFSRREDATYEGEIPSWGEPRSP